MQIDYRIQFGKRLQKILQEREISRQQLATLTKCTNATIGHWVRGTAPYSFQVLAELHNTYGIDLNWLLCGPRKEVKNADASNASFSFGSKHQSARMG